MTPCTGTWRWLAGVERYIMQEPPSWYSRRERLALGMQMEGVKGTQSNLVYAWGNARCAHPPPSFVAVRSALSTCTSAAHMVEHLKEWRSA